MKEQMKERDNELIKRKVKRVSLKERGITLIALVVTIIVLLILTGVTLNMALSDNGLFKRAQEAADKYKKAQEDEEDILEELENQLDNLTSILMADAKEKGKFENTTVVEDKYGNKIVIPGKFKIAENSGDTVQEGIVIEDSDENQFVWIPVSNVDGDNNASTKGEEQKEEDLIKLNNGEKVEITLGRYTFKREQNQETMLWEDGTPTLVQNGSEYTNETDIDNVYKETTSSNHTDGGVGAKDLKSFKESVEKNHGYYIARYEAGKGEDEKTPVSMVGKVWNNVTQEEASTVAKEMYKEGDVEATFVESDLVNSYAWDTAIVYIQAMGNANYANEGRGSNTELKDTGVNDEKCHIFDMAGNVSEWTTEYSTNKNDRGNNPCVYRGGHYNSDSKCTAYRDNNISNHENIALGFRVLLYLK